MGEIKLDASVIANGVIVTVVGGVLLWLVIQQLKKSVRQLAYAIGAAVILGSLWTLLMQPDDVPASKQAVSVMFVVSMLFTVAVGLSCWLVLAAQEKRLDAIERHIAPSRTPGPPQ